MKPNLTQAERIERAARIMWDLGYEPEQSIERYVEEFDVHTNAPLIGGPNCSEYDVFALTIEAARVLCGMDYRLARDLLRRAAIELDSRNRMDCPCCGMGDSGEERGLARREGTARRPLSTQGHVGVWLSALG